MSLHAEKQKLANGNVSYRIRYWDNNKHKTISSTVHVEFKSIEEAREFCKIQNAKIEADRHLEKFAKGMDAIAWKNKYADLSKEVLEFIEWYKDEAPNSWETARNWLQHYVLPYFIGKGI